MSQGNKPVAAFILSIAAGVLMLIGGAIALTWAYYPSWNGWRGMMMPMMMWWMPWMWWIPAIIGIASGAVIIIGALAIFSDPKLSQVWGAIILVFSLVGLVGFGGFIVGSLLGIVGGILALTWKTPAEKG
ncbi:MAG: DUF6114 domain-containing protein [Nitrososphaerota archaeon]